MSRLSQLGNRLYRGDVSIDFVGRRRTWYAVSAVLLGIAFVAIVLRGVTFGIEFEGGVEFRAQVAAPAQSVEPLREAVVGTGLEDDPVVVSSGEETVRVQTQELSAAQIDQISDALRDAGATGVSSDFVGPSWGEQVANRALLGLGVFLVLVMLFIGIYFREWKMSISALVALGHDLLITVGVYALSGFEVTPATVTGLLTILGYSLYDTVVVFDKVRENTRGQASSTRRTYAESANLAVNQTLVRSINTSIAALLPVAAILWVGVVQLGSGPLKDLALALFVGMAAGTYSSVFVATPLLVQLKQREPKVQEQTRRVRARRGDAPPPLVGVAAGTTGGATAFSPDDEPRPAPRSTRPASRPMSSTSTRRSQPQRQSRAKRGRGGRR